jgi:hypothetical protein
LLHMGLKPGYSPSGRNTGWGCWAEGRWGTHVHMKCDVVSAINLGTMQYSSTTPDLEIRGRRVVSFKPWQLYHAVQLHQPWLRNLREESSQPQALAALPWGTAPPILT